MAIRYLFTTKKYWVTFIVSIAISFLAGMIFSNVINNSLYCINTWKNCSSTYIAFDSREFSNNCYIYYEKNVPINLSTGDSVRINAEVYQFKSDGNYNEKSLLSGKNVVAGTYKNLSGQEIAIPESLAGKYNLTVGDKLYVFGEKEYKIAYIFRNIFDIKEPNMYSSSNVVFLGSSDNLLSTNYKYAIFDNVTTDYNEVYLFKNAKKNFLTNLVIYTVIIAVISTALSVCVTLFYRKTEYKNLYKSAISGSKKTYYGALFGVNFALLLPIIVAAIVLVLLKDYVASGCIFATSLLVYVIKIIILKSRTK